MTATRTTIVLIVFMLVPATLAGLAPPGVAHGDPDARAQPAHPPGPEAHAARSMQASDTAHLRYLRASGSLLIEEGPAGGTLPGSMRVHLDVGPTLTGSFTIYTRSGSIKGRGTATPHGSGTVESFAGTLLATGGTGRYTHAHGRAGLYGTFNRDSYALTVQTTGRLSY